MQEPTAFCVRQNAPDINKWTRRSIGWCNASSVPTTTPTVYKYLPSYRKLGNCLLFFTIQIQILFLYIFYSNAQNWIIHGTGHCLLGVLCIDFHVTGSKVGAQHKYAIDWSADIPSVSLYYILSNSCTVVLGSNKWVCLRKWQLHIYI